MPVGRPQTQVNPIRVAEMIGELGGTESKLAYALGVTLDAIQHFKKRNRQLFITLRERKRIADESVEKALYQRAIGYSHKAVKIFKTSDDKILEHEYIERFPPDPVACIFWLKNRMPDEWRERREPDVSQTNIQVNGVSKDFLGTLRDLARKQLNPPKPRLGTGKAKEVIDVQANKQD
jgi:hypothetical protein